MPRLPHDAGDAQGLRHLKELHLVLGVWPGQAAVG